MTIAIVVDFYFNKSNGTAVSANNLAQALVQKGHNVRVVSVGDSRESDSSDSRDLTHPLTPSAREGESITFFPIKERFIPIVTPISKKQNICFGKPDEKALREAFKGADIVHLFLPFKLEILAAKIARELKIPIIMGFHLQPQNITYNAHLHAIPLLNRLIFWLFWRRFYRFADFIHCPSDLIKNELERAKYRANLRVISNGFTPRLVCANRQSLNERKSADSRFHITMTGRYTREKRQEILIRAVKLSKFEREIVLHLKGLGPREEYYRKLAQTLTNGADLGFASDSDLIALLAKTDLYVHTSDVDGESISTLEAISNGIVPLISDSATSATKQFALDSRSLFRAGDAEDLARKIDYFFTNRAELESLSEKYKERAKQYDLSACVDKMIALYEEAVGLRESR